MTDYLHLPGLTGESATTPDATPLDITGDLEMICRISTDDWTTGAERHILGQFAATVDQRGYLLILNASKQLGIRWSSAGSDNTVCTTTTGIVSKTGVIPGQRLWLRVACDVGTDARFFYSLDDTNDVDAVVWVSYEEVTTDAPTGFFNNTAAVEIGASNAGVAQPWEGNGYRFVIKDGLDGTVEFDADLTAITAADLEAGNFTESSSEAATVTLNGDAWTYVPVYTVHDILRETEALYMAGDGNKFHSPKWADRSGNNHHARNGSTDGADANDALGKTHDGLLYVNQDSTTVGNWMSTPDAAPLDVTGDMEVRIRFALPDISPAESPSIMGKWDDAPNLSWRVFVNSSGGMGFAWSDDGTATTTHTFTVTLPGVGFTDGDLIWFRVTFDVDDGAGDSTVIAYYSMDDTNDPDAVTWTQLGATEKSGSTESIHNGAALLGFGGVESENGGERGDYYRMQVLNGIGGTVVFDAVVDDATQPYATFTERSVNAAVVTINRGTTGRVATVIDQDQWLHSTDDYHEAPDAPGLNFAAGESFTVMAVARTHDATPAAAITLVAKKTGFASSAVGYSIQNADTGAGLFRIADGTVGIFDTFADITDGELFTYAGVRDVTTDDLEAFLDAVPAATPTSDTTTATLSNTEVLRIGRFSGAGAGDYEGSIMAVAIWRRALTDAEILDAHRLLTGQGLVKDNYLHLPGVAGNMVSSPDSAALSIAGDIDIICRVTPEAWDNSTVLVSKMPDSGLFGYRFKSQASKALVYAWGDGSAFSGDKALTPHALVDGEPTWVRVTHDVDDGASDDLITFYTSHDVTNDPDQVTWAVLGTLTNGSATSIGDDATGLQLGQFTAATGPFLGGIYRAVIKDGIDGTVVFDADLTKLTAADLEAGTFLEDANDAVATLNGNQLAYTRPYPHDDLLATAELLLMAHDENKFHSPKWADRSRRNHHFQLGTAAGADSGDALGKRHDGDQYARLPGTASNVLTSPTATDLDLTDDAEWRFDVALDTYTPASDKRIFARDAGSPNRGWGMAILTDGKLLLFTEDGSGGFGDTFVTSVVPSLTDGRRYQFQVTLDATTPTTVKWFFREAVVDLASDEEWVQIGGNISGPGAQTWKAITAEVQIGADGGGNQRAVGDYYRAILYDGIGGTILFDADLEDAASPFATFTERSSNAATVTINRSDPPGLVSTVIDRDQWLLTTDDLFEYDDTDTDSFEWGTDDSFTIMAVLRHEEFDGATGGGVIDKSGGYGIEAGWRMFETGTGGDLRLEVADGAAEEGVPTTGGPMSVNVLTSNTGRRIAGTEIAVFIDGVNKATATDTGLDLTGGQQTIFMARTGGVDELEGQYIALAIWRRALTDAEVLEAHNLLFRQVQYLRPDSDVTVGGWTPTPASPTTLFDKVDEVLPADVDFITEA